MYRAPFASLDLCMFLKNTTLVFYKTVFVISAKLKTNYRAISSCVLRTEVWPLEPARSNRVWTLQSVIRSRPSREVTAS